MPRNRSAKTIGCARSGIGGSADRERIAALNRAIVAGTLTQTVAVSNSTAAPQTNAARDTRRVRTSIDASAMATAAATINHSLTSGAPTSNVSRESVGAGL